MHSVVSCDLDAAVLLTVEAMTCLNALFVRLWHDQFGFKVTNANLRN